MNILRNQLIFLAKVLKDSHYEWDTAHGGIVVVALSSIFKNLSNELE